MNEHAAAPHIATLRLALRPLMRLAVRHSVRLLEVIELLKLVFLEVAAEELEHRGEKPNVSKLSVMTGVHRKDAARLYRDKGEIRRPPDVLSRTLGLWRNSALYQTSAGAPRVLTYEGPESEFVQLVREVTTDVAPHTVLHELQRRQMVERSARGLRLLTAQRTTLPTEVLEGYKMMGEDIADLLDAGEFNLREETTDRTLHLKTEFDNIPQSAARQLRAWLLAEGSRMHSRVERYLSRFDRDVAPSRAKGHSVRVSYGSFAWIDDAERGED